MSRWLGVNLLTLIICSSISPNNTKLGSFVVHLTRIKKYTWHVDFCDDVIIFYWWRHQNSVFWRSMGKSVYIFWFLSGEVGWPLKWKLISSSLRMNYIHWSIWLLPGIIPGKFPGNNDKNALWRHNDVTWPDFLVNHKSQFTISQVFAYFMP